MKAVAILFAAVALALAACSAPRAAWVMPADLAVGDAQTLVGDAARAGRLADLLEQAETTVFNTDEARMAEILAAALATGQLDETQTATAEWMLHDVCLRNAPGTPAADITALTLAGDTLRLSSFAPSEPVALVLYDPDCDHCRDVIAELAPLGRSVKVLAVSIAGGEQRWRQSAATLPADWTTALDLSNIMATDLYVVRSTPSLYLLDAARRVVLKNPTPATLLETARRL